MLPTMRVRVFVIAAVGLYAGVAVAACPKGTKQERLQVRKGETLVDFAARAGVEAADVKAWNRMKTDGVWARRTLVVCRSSSPSSVGTTGHGKLVGGKSIDDDGDLKGNGFVIGKGRTRLFATPAVVDIVKRCAAQYRQVFPDKKKHPPVNVGDLSAKYGGEAGPHVSHESGRDVDIGYLTKPAQSIGIFDREATRNNLDVAPQWHITRCFLDEPRLKTIFISHEVAQALRAHVEKVYKKNGPVRRRYLAWLDKRLSPDSEHLTHMHVRFKCAPSDKKCVD
jgi:murein endopeptidase